MGTCLEVVGPLQPVLGRQSYSTMQRHNNRRNNGLARARASHAGGPGPVGLRWIPLGQGGFTSDTV